MTFQGTPAEESQTPKTRSRSETRFSNNSIATCPRDHRRPKTLATLLLCITTTSFSRTRFRRSRPAATPTYPSSTSTRVTNNNSNSSINSNSTTKISSISYTRTYRSFRRLRLWQRPRLRIGRHPTTKLAPVLITTKSA